MALFYSVLAIAAANGAHVSSRDPNWVSNTIDDIDTDCTQAKCGSAIHDCKDAGHVCSKRISCAFDADKPKECWAGVKWSELHPHELKIFNCATSKGCIPSSPGASLLQAYAVDEAGAAEYEAQLRNEDGSQLMSELDDKEYKRRMLAKADLLERLAAMHQKLSVHANMIMDHSSKAEAMKEMLAGLKAKSHADYKPSKKSLLELEDVQQQLQLLQEHMSDIAPEH